MSAHGGNINETNGYRDIHKFTMGELRVDGWKSPWRIEQEGRRQEEMGRRQFVSAPQIIERRRTYYRRADAKRSMRHGSRECELCPTIIRKDNITGRCSTHKPFRQPILRSHCPYTGCENLLNHKNLYGICKKHFLEFRGRLRQKMVRICAEPGCGLVIRPDCTITRCRKHARPERRVIENARMRKVRELERQLKKAA
jgi:hypothetical protein